MASCNKGQKMEGMVAIVTGSSSGIGAGIAIEFSRLGAKLTITGRKEDKLKDVAKKCEEASCKKHKPLVILGDVTNEEIRKKLIDDTVKEFGRIDVLVNNAGTMVSIPAEMNCGVKPLDNMLDIHVRAPYHLSKLAFPHLVAAKGAVINISSIAGMRVVGTIGLEYAVAKAAMDMMTKWFASELGAKGVRVNSINPGAITTDLMVNAGFSEEAAKKTYESAGSIHALNRVGQVEEVARVAVFLATKDSSFVTGVILPVDGGALVKSTVKFEEFDTITK